MSRLNSIYPRTIIPLVITILFVIAVLLVSAILAAPIANAQVEPQAGSWKTWVIGSGQEFRLPPPPDQKATKRELEELLLLQQQQSNSAISQIQYWNAGAPGYRWTQLASQLGKGSTTGFRTVALLHVAIYDATIAAWDTKYTYNRSRPSRVNAQVKPMLATPESPSYPCEHSVAAGAAATLLSWLFPEKEDSIQLLAQQACQSRVLAGVQYPSDVRAGFELGCKVDLQVIQRAKQDGSDRVWQGEVPHKAGLWQGINPVGTTWGSWKPWVLDSASQYRPGPPPDFARDMQEVKNYKQTPQSKARFYYFATQDVWTDITHQKLFEYNLHTNPPRAARVYALKSIALYDASLACWEAKYTYWGIRPYQYDSTFTQALGKPPFPSYPSGHAALSGTAAAVLAYLFPGEGKHFQQKAEECAESRFEGGLHFRTDNEVGLQLGLKIGERIIERAKADGADTSLQLMNKPQRVGKQ